MVGSFNNYADTVCKLWRWNFNMQDQANSFCVVSFFWQQIVLVLFLLLVEIEMLFKSYPILYFGN